MRKTIDKKEIKEYLNGAIHNYEQFSNKKYNSNDGYSQVPENNFMAMFWFGKISAYAQLLTIGKY